jgi:Mg-chelatase subunit ChlD
VGSVNLGGGGDGGSGAGGWKGMLRRLRRNGLDIVLVFDSTSSMSGEINQVKAQIYRIGTALVRLVPGTRISLCTYRDTGDAYLVLGTPLTDDLSTIETFLRRISAGGGGDTEEAVQEGLQWAVGNNDFRPGARKVILLFGDAPPHRQDLATCVRTARDFHDQQQGIVSTVTCRQVRPLIEFIEIAEAGGGEAFLTVNERQIMTQLMVLVFGSRYRDKVVEALQLMRP